MENPSQCYGASSAMRDHTVLPVPPDTGECAPPKPQLDKPELNLPISYGPKAELTSVLVIYTKKVYLSP